MTEPVPGEPALHSLPPWCEHAAGCHDGSRLSPASAPPASRAWLLLEHYGPWPERIPDAVLPTALKAAATAATERRIRVQLIRRPGRRPRQPAPAAVYLGWVAGPHPWLRRGDLPGTSELTPAVLDCLRDGRIPGFGEPAAGPLALICTHGRRNVCCARFGGPLARATARQFGDLVWETSHVGGDENAANLVLLPHAHYYGPVDSASAAAAITGYQRGELPASRYRGRAGHSYADQAAMHSALVQAQATPA